MLRELIAVSVQAMKNVMETYAKVRTRVYLHSITCITASLLIVYKSLVFI